jgi:hypothetical protein
VVTGANGRRLSKIDLAGYAAMTKAGRTARRSRSLHRAPDLPAAAAGLPAGPVQSRIVDANDLKTHGRVAGKAPRWASSAIATSAAARSTASRRLTESEPPSSARNLAQVREPGAPRWCGRRDLPASETAPSRGQLAGFRLVSRHDCEHLTPVIGHALDIVNEVARKPNKHRRSCACMFAISALLRRHQA